MWFWFTVAVVVLLQIPIVALVPWPDRRFTSYGHGIVVVASLLDWSIMYGIVRLAERVFKRRDKKDSPK